MRLIVWRKPKAVLKKLSEILESAKFPLTRWTSNDSEILRDVAESKRIELYIELEKLEGSIRIIGLHYSPKEDCFRYKINLCEKIVYTKRRVLSLAASIYDPIGWLLSS